jgi:hypothetical protein
MCITTFSSAETSHGMSLRIYLSLSFFSLTLPLPIPTQSPCPPPEGHITFEALVRIWSLTDTVGLCTCDQNVQELIGGQHME